METTVTRRGHQHTGSDLGTVVRASGTSMAAPQVAAAAALVLSAAPALAPAEVAARLIAGADPGPEFKESGGFRWRLGAGRLNLLRALRATAAPAIVLKGYRVVSDPDGQGVLADVAARCGAHWRFQAAAAAAMTAALRAGRFLPQPRRGDCGWRSIRAGG